MSMIRAPNPPVYSRHASTVATLAAFAPGLHVGFEVSALFSEGGEAEALYRWRLDREVNALLGGPVVALIGVNPSKAGAMVNDATIRKDIGFAQRHGWQRIIKGNKFAFRSTDVRALAKAADPIGPDNDAHLAAIMAEADIIVPCWGPLSKLPKRLRTRWRDVAAMAVATGKPVLCLGTALDGQPLHPLMLSYSTPLVNWQPPS